MKCVCGYEYKEEWDEGAKRVAIGGEEFTPIDTKATVEDTGSYHRTQYDIHLYICPKCGTVRAERW